MSETTATETGETSQETTETVVDWKLEAEKWKNLSRKNEQKARENAAAASELEKVREASKTEFEKAVEAARHEGRALGLKEAGRSTVAAEFKAAFARNEYQGDIDAFLDSLSTDKFMDDQGKPNADAIAELVEKFAPKPGPASTAHAQQTNNYPPALNSDALLDALKAATGAH